MGKNFVREFRIVKQRNRIEGIDEKEDYDITLAGTENMTEILFENMTKKLHLAGIYCFQWLPK